MKPELISLTDWPTMPAPMQSSDAGEAWVWGDFFAVLQKKPMLVGQAMQAMTGKSVTQAQTMEYPYAMFVFYDKAKNPHGPSSRPVLCVGLEQADFGALAARLGNEAAKYPELARAGKGPLMVGVFTGTGRMNLGEFDGLVTADSARERFFDVVHSQLGLTGKPERIGTINDVYGHPQTGWPANKAASRKPTHGCLGLLTFLMCFLIFVLTALRL